MGLDVLLCAENQENLFPRDYSMHANPELNHALSRSFCNLMFRQHAIERGEPELDQIGRIASVDIQPIYDMENYKHDDDEETAFHLSMAETKAEKQRVLDQAKQNRDKVKGNVDTVLATINALIEKLSRIDSLNKLLDTNDHEMHGHDEYFTDFNKDKGDGYLHNNFGQDLRNFKRFLEYAKDKGATTVYFQYG
jgi:hypothetical protein